MDASSHTLGAESTTKGDTNTENEEEHIKINAEKIDDLTELTKNNKW